LYAEFLCTNSLPFATAFYAEFAIPS